MFTGCSSRWDDRAIFLLFKDGSSLEGHFPQSFSRTSDARSPLSSSSLSSELSPPAFELAQHWGLLGQASTTLDQSVDSTTEKYAAQSCPHIFKSMNDYITTKRN